MKHKTSGLDGALLDAAVAKADGLQFVIESYMTLPPTPIACWLCNAGHRVDFTTPQMPYRPSADWARGGPIIEREQIELSPVVRERWVASACGTDFNEAGPTPLIAAMRAYVASKFGEEVELP